MKSDFELSFKMTEEEKRKNQKNLLENGGVRHYLLKLTDGTELDVVEYKEYQNLEIENQKYKEVIDKLNKCMYSGYLINSKEIKDILKEWNK